jgi:mannose/fructose/N-acetylgalactosamine-specific phosphotransferase system component IIB
VDDRLIHGQVTVDWRRHLQYDEIWVVDDGVRDDSYVSDVLRMTSPAGVVLHVYGVQEAVAAWTASSPVPENQSPAQAISLPTAPASAREALAESLDALQPRCVLVLVKNPQTVLDLVERGIALPHLNVGCLASKPGSVRAFRSISLTREDVNALDGLADRGVRITFQLTPDGAHAEWPTVRGRLP